MASSRFDWGITILSVWLAVGFYADLWAHAHGRVDDTFLTPWHAILYAGAATFALTLGALAARNLARGGPWRLALPGPYLVSLAGAIAFVLAGQLDFVWHSMFGFEVSVEALVSPSHLALAASGVVMVSGPVRSVWSRPIAAASWRVHGPAVIGLALILSLFAAFTQYAHPIVDPWSEGSVGEDATGLPISQLYAMAADGTGQRRIAITDGSDGNPRLSPDGRRLAFDARADDLEQIMVSQPDGSNRRAITTEGHNGRPAWSPDGTRLAFQSDRAGSLDVFTMAADGTDVRRVTDEPSLDWGATWSPDGTRIAFTSDRNGSYDIYVARADGTDVVRLTQGDGGEFDPAWSPDGRRIAFAEQAGDGVAVVSMAVDGTDVRRLTVADDDSFGPVWSPDGRSIAFATRRDGDVEVYAMNADGTNQRNLTRSPAMDDALRGLSWSPDGLAILYAGQGEAADVDVAFMREALGAASILIQAALLAGFALVALRRSPVPFGGLTILVFVPTVLITLLSDEYRFLPGALVAGIVLDLLVRRRPFGSSRGSDAVIAFAIPAVFYAAYFVTVQLTVGIGWTVHLWLGAIVLAGITGLALDEAMRIGRRASTPMPPVAS